MATTNPEIDALQEYIDQNSKELIAKAVLEPMSTKLFSLQTGVKAKTAINLLDVDVEFTDGTVCGWDPKGSDTISQRAIDPGFLKVEKVFCHKNFLNTFANYMVGYAAGRETLPFQEYFVNENLKAIGAKLETAIWNGIHGISTEADFDGLFDILKAEVNLGTTQNVYAADKSMYERVWDVYMAIGDEWIDQAVIYMSKQDYRSLIKEMIDANQFHYGQNINDFPTIEDGSMQMILPGTTTLIKAVDGMKHTAGQDGVIVAMDPKHTVYGVDMESTNDDFHFWFSTDNEEFRLRVNLSVGVQVALPSEIVVSANWE